MRFDIVTSLVLVLVGTCSYLGSCESDDVRAEVSERSYPPRIGQKSHPLATRVTGHVDGDLSVAANPIGSAVSERKLFRREIAEEWSTEEEKLLIKLRVGEQLPWAKIVGYFPERTGRAVVARYYKITRDPSEPSREMRFWTDKELETLLELKEKNMSWDYIANHLPGRSKRAVEQKYENLFRDTKIPKTILRKYTPEEDKLLLELGKKKIPWKERVAYFDNRPLSGLKSRYSQIAPKEVLRSRDFTPEEDEIIINGVAQGKTRAEVSRSLGRNDASVRRRIQILVRLNRLKPVQFKVNGRPYEDAELELIRKMVNQGMGWEEIAAQHLSGRTSKGIQSAYYKYLSTGQRTSEKKKNKSKKKSEEVNDVSH